MPTCPSPWTLMLLRTECTQRDIYYTHIYQTHIYQTWHTFIKYDTHLSNMTYIYQTWHIYQNCKNVLYFYDACFSMHETAISVYFVKQKNKKNKWQTPLFALSRQLACKFVNFFDVSDGCFKRFLAFLIWTLIVLIVSTIFTSNDLQYIDVCKCYFITHTQTEMFYVYLNWYKHCSGLSALCLGRQTVCLSA